MMYFVYPRVFYNVSTHYILHAHVQYITNDVHLFRLVSNDRPYVTFREQTVTQTYGNNNNYF